tara:strand:- start:3705 stop:4706 length:1002 start_codon:yes stop_codon:yes gene_type:complete
MSNKYYLIRSPFRVSLLGGGTDYPEYFFENKGAVLGFSINKYIYLGGLLTNDYVDYKYKLSYSKLETTEKIDEIKHPAVREGMKLLNFKLPIDFSFQADLPASSGLGSSSSFSVGFLKLIYEIQNKKISKKDIANLAIQLDRDILKQEVGLQDHLHAAYGGFNKFSFTGKEIVRKKVHLDINQVSEMEKNMILVFTGKKRSASKIASEQIEKTKNNKINQDLNEIYEMVEEGEKIFSNFNKSTPKEIGNLLNEYWKIKKGLTSKISMNKIDDIYENAIKTGAYGGKLCGAGGGGFFLFFIPKYKRKTFKKVFGDKNCIDFKIDYSGTQLIFKG